MTSGDPLQPRPRIGSELPLEERLQRLSKPLVRGERYEREEKLAQGGMGAVYRVHDVELNRALALKEIGPGVLGKDPLAAARFYEEAQVTAQLDHPGIVPIHELGIDAAGHLYFAMKLVQGRDLRTILDLARDGQEGWNRTRVLGVLLKVCEAMAYAHSKGVIHRDLKPANVMVGHFGEVYVMDWGLARVMGRKDVHDIRLKMGEEAAESVRTVMREAREESTDSPFVTMDGVVVGTPCYMPPEQARGDVHLLSPRSDVYSIGTMLYHLLAGRTPYVTPGTRVSKHTVLARVIDGPPRRLQELDPKAPVELVAICDKAMARDPEQRYPDTLALAEDLRSYLEGRVVRAHETGAVAELRKWVARNKGLASAAAAAILALVGGFVTSFRLYLTAESESALAARERERANEKAAEAEHRTEEVMRLSALQDLEGLGSEADGLWPILPASAPALEDWIARAQRIVAALPEHRRKHAELVASGENVWWQNQLARLIAGLEAFADPEHGLFSRGISPEHGWGVPRRLEFARTLAERSLSGPEARARWDEASAAIRDPRTCPAYHGLVLAPQIGLLPLGPDPSSNLWEFAHLESGEPPVRGPDGHLVLADGFGIVLVLLPGGTFQMGAQSTAPRMPNYDALADQDERPVHTERVSPFFLAKFELTRGQWLRLTGRAPSLRAGGDRFPVQGVSWLACDELCRRMGLALPSEAQWEYGARAGTQTRWWTGDDPDALILVANLADQSRKRGAGAMDRVFEAWDDGLDLECEVGRLAPNDFGLHDVCGNVWEWCADWYDVYPSDDAGTDSRGPRDLGSRVYRGGSFQDSAVLVRSASRFSGAPDLATDHIGLRPARPIDP